MIWKLAEAGMNVARLNMSHGDHASHQKTIDLVKEYNAQFQDKVVAIMLDTKVTIGWLNLLHPENIHLYLMGYGFWHITKDILLHHVPLCHWLYVNLLVFFKRKYYEQKLYFYFYFYLAS